MRYPDGGGLTAAGRVRRESVRLRAARMYEQDVSPVQVAHRLRVSTKSAYQWRRRWRAGGEAALESKGPGGAVCRLNDRQLARLRAALNSGPAAWGWGQDQRWTLARVNQQGTTDQDISILLSRALHTAAGVSNKQSARVDVISPLLLEASHTHSVEQILSGEVLFHFGGFLDENMRRSDFDVGYASTLAWLDQGGLSDAGLPSDLADQALEAATASYRPGTGWEQTGATTVGSLLAMYPWQTARLAGKITQVLLHDLLHHPHP